MALSTTAFLALLTAVGASRLIEIVISRRHQRVLEALGAVRVADRRFPLMVSLHTAILAGGALEVVALHRPLIRPLAITMAGVFVCADAVRWSVIWTLGRHWSVQVMNSMHLGVVTAGPYRYVRHPNYAAVFVELIALPLIHSAWLTALIGTAAHLWILAQRMSLEETMLLADPSYRVAMAHKPRCVPNLFRARARQRAAGPTWRHDGLDRNAQRGNRPSDKTLRDLSVRPVHGYERRH